MPLEDLQNDTISITWHIDDVLNVRPELTKDQARSVLRNLDHNHDANIGINWDVIACVARLMFPENES